MNAVFPRTFCHFDYRFANMLWKEGSDEPYLVDWQTVLGGIGISDLSHFITLDFSIELRRKYEARILQTYAETLISCGVDTTFEEVKHQYQLSLFVNDLFALCVVSSILRFEQEEDAKLAIRWIERTFSAIIDNDSINVTKKFLTEKVKKKVM